MHWRCASLYMRPAIKLTKPRRILRNADYVGACTLPESRSFREQRREVR